MVAAPLIIDLARLDPDGERFAGTIPSDVLELEGIDTVLFVPRGDIGYDITARQIGNELLVQGSAWQPMTSTCVRCTRQFEWESRDPGILFSVELGEDDFLDLTAYIREAILMGFPNHPVCAEECEGLCPTCGVDLNSAECGCTPPADGRWEALDGLASRLGDAKPEN